VKKIAIVFLAMALLIIPAYAQNKIFEIDLTFYKNNTVEVNDITAKLGYPLQSNPGKYSVELISKGNTLTIVDLPIVFMILSDPPRLIDTIHKTISLDYFPEAEYLVVKNEGKEILRYNIADKLCNSNKLCNEMETFYSCPKDCPLGSKDGVCIKDKDGFCDPDCLEGIDPDCLEKPKPKTNIFLYLGMGVALIIIILAVFILSRKRSQSINPSQPPDYPRQHI